MRFVIRLIAISQYFNVQVIETWDTFENAFDLEITLSGHIDTHENCETRIEVRLLTFKSALLGIGIIFLPKIRNRGENMKYKKFWTIFEYLRRKSIIRKYEYNRKEEENDEKGRHTIQKNGILYKWSHDIINIFNESTFPFQRYLLY